MQICITSACSNAVNPIRIHPITMLIILHHYKMLKEQTSSFVQFDILLMVIMRMAMMNIKDYNNNYSTRLKQDKWYNFSFVLRKKDRMLFAKCYNHHTNIHLQ
ncbi:MAG TPA: hypothetical protein VIQ04_00040 [Nitrososphaeraceae archaeon]